MTNWKRSLTRTQEIVIRTFLTILGMVLMFIAFYAVSLEKLLMTDDNYSLDAENYTMAGASVLFIWAALDLGRISKIVDFIGQKIGFTQKNTNSENHGKDAL